MEIIVEHEGEDKGGERIFKPQTLREMEIYMKGQEEIRCEYSDKYASHKSVSQNLLNTSIVQSHIGSLVYILVEIQDLGDLEYTAIALISASLIIQTIIFFALVWLFYRRQDYNTNLLSAPGVNIGVTTLSGVSLMINMAITAIMLNIRPDIRNDT